MDGAAPISQVITVRAGIEPPSPLARAIASVVPPAELQLLQRRIAEHDAAAERAMADIREIEAEAAGAPRRDERLLHARRDRLRALDDASKARVRAQPLLQAHRAELMRVLAPLADKIAADLCQKLDALCEEIAPLLVDHNELSRAISRSGGISLPLPGVGLPDQFNMLVRSLTAFSESRAKAAAARPRGLFGRKR